MVTLTPFNSMLDRMATLTRAMDDAYEQTSNGSKVASWAPELDAYETEQAYVVSIDLPGVRGDQVDIDFDRNTLTVRGTRERAIPTGDEVKRIYFGERVSGAFERSLRFPHHIDAEKISASFSDGMLTITVPKSEAAKPRKIAIQAGN